MKKTIGFAVGAGVLLLVIGYVTAIWVQRSREMVVDETANAPVVTDEKPAVEVTPITHAAMVLSWDDVVIYNDPTDAAGFAGQPAPDMILVSDIHGDHYNAPALQALLVDGAELIAPQAVIDLMPEELKLRATALANGNTLVQDGITVEAVPMYNVPETADSRHVKGRGNGYVLSKDEFRVYVAGDTSGTPEMRALTDIDWAFVPMNGPTMTVEEAAGAVLDFAPRRVYPYHYRSQGGLSDVAAFKQLVNDGNEAIDVVQLNWYPTPPTATPAPTPTLAANPWKWVEAKLPNGETVTPKQADKFVITFGADGRLTGTTDCNSFFGTFESIDGKLSFPGPFGATKMYCEGAQEGDFMVLLGLSESYAVSADGQLTLNMKNGGTMTFKK